MKWLTAVLAVTAAAAPPSERVSLPGIKQPVEILRDRWGVPHIYAANSDDLFFAQGWMAARDRLFQLDLWRRSGNGTLSEVAGERALSRDHVARLFRYRGDWNAEWTAYAPDTKAIVTSFAAGINAYIKALGGRRPREFQHAGFDPGFWSPEDCLSRIPTLTMTRNLTQEVSHAQDTLRFGVAALPRLLRFEPPVRLEVPSGLDLDGISGEISAGVTAATGEVTLDSDGSNNWVVDGTLSATGKPLLASDPHRPIRLPSLRKTWHLVAPGWNVFGAGEPALPGIALGHNEAIGFGFTIVGIDQNDLYVEKLNPANPDEYMYRGSWRRMEIARETIGVKGQASRTLELRYTIHGPVLHYDARGLRAYALRSIASEPGGAGYLAALSLSRARNWTEFLAAAARYKAPSENLVYADTQGNIGWQVAGWSPLRKNWSGLLPVPGDSGAYEWAGFLPPDQLPRKHNPPEHWIATANHKILPPGYPHQLGYQWAQPFRFERVREMLTSAKQKFAAADFELMQQDVLSVPARRFQGVLRRWSPPSDRARAVVERLLKWDARLTVDSAEALIFEVWFAKLPAAVLGPRDGSRAVLTALLESLEKETPAAALGSTLDATLAELDRTYGADMGQWRWGKLHQIRFRHPTGDASLDRGPVARPGDGNTVNSTSGARFLQTNGASYRMVLDFADWDRSVMTNVPGESGDPASPYYSNLVEDWAQGRYHPMPFSRKAVEAAAAERILLTPAM